MAVKASAQITISKVIDIYACYRYYKLQSSTLVKPAKPTTNPPSGWSDTEPAYVSGSTNTLYFVDCNVYSDQSFSFSEVSISSSYEAAKDAWNKANKALNDTVVSVDVEYYLSTSATSLTGGSWSTTAPTWANGKYMWSRTVTVDGAGNKTYSPSQNGVCIAGAKGDTGAKGDKGDTGGTGAAGKGVTSIVEQYYKSTSATSLAGGSWSTTYPGWESGKYIWTRSVITYTDNTTSTTTAVCVTGTKGDTGAKGDKGDTGVAGKGVKSSSVTYQASTSGTTIPTGTWSTTIPSVAAGSFLWTKTVITYTDNTTTTSYSVGKMGSNGSKGDTGATGKGVKSTAVTYQASTSGTTVPTGTWSSTIPSVSAGSFLWTRTIIAYTDDTTSTSYSIGKMGNTGATGAIGETLSNGKLLYKDVMFAEGNNGISSYNNSSGGAVTLVRQAKSSDNPCGDYELVITNTGAASPGIGGFKWAHATRANAVFIYRIIAKIPTDRALRWMSNSAGGVTSGKFLTSNSGTGKFTEYIYKFTCGASGTFGTTGCFYINGSAGSSSSPVKWYVAYAGVWDMTDYEDMLPKDEAKDIYTTQLEMSKTNSELRLDFTKSIASASDDMQSKLDAANNATNQKFGEISKYIRFVDGKIVLGETGSELTLTVQNDRVSFQQAGNEVAYFSNNNLYIRRAEVLTTLKVGNYEFAPRNDGGLALRKRGN